MSTNEKLSELERLDEEERLYYQKFCVAPTANLLSLIAEVIQKKQAIYGQCWEEKEKVKI